HLATLTSLVVYPFDPYISHVGALVAAGGGETWTHTGRIGSRGRLLSSMVIDPSDPSRLFAGVNASNGGGIHRSTDGGATWPFAMNGVTDTAVTSLAIDPADPDVVYAGTRRGRVGGHVFKTIDGGDHWHVMSGPVP